MTQLLRFHFRFSSKALLILLLIVILLVIIYSNEILNLNMVSLVFLLNVYLPTICIAHILSGEFSLLMRTFPISLKTFVQSTFLYVLLLFSFFMIPVLFMLGYQLLQGQIQTFTMCYILGIVAFSVVTTGGALKAHFKQPSHSKSISGSDMFFYIFITFIAHTSLSSIFYFIGLLYVGALITPICSFIIFYKQYKASITLYENAEFL